MPKCSICGNPEASYTEGRNTGKNGREQTWCYCSKCWQALQEQRRDTDAEICQRYIIFLKYLAGYRMQRAFMGNLASKILPGKERP